MPCRVMTQCFHSNLLMFCNSKCLAHTSAPASLSCVSLLFDLNQQHHKCSKSCQQRDSSLSWRCEYFVSACLCLCIIMNWQRVTYNLRGESFTTCCGRWSQTAASSIDMFVFPFSKPRPIQSHRMLWDEHKHCSNSYMAMDIMSNIFLPIQIWLREDSNRKFVFICFSLFTLNHINIIPSILCLHMGSDLSSVF